MSCRVPNSFLIDTGMPGNSKKIIHYIKGLGKNASDIKYIILTHADIDHIGSAADIKKLTGAQLVIHTNDAPILTGKSRMKTIKGPIGLILKVMLRLMMFIRYDPISLSRKISTWPASKLSIPQGILRAASPSTNRGN